MANGATVRLPCTPEIPVGHPETRADQPGVVSASEVERAIGEAVAAGATMLCRAILGHRETGVLDPEVKDVFSARIVAVAMLQLDHEFGDADFTRKARSSGSARLRQYFTDDCHGPHDADAAINVCLDELLGIVSMVVRDERILRTAWAN